MNLKIFQNTFLETGLNIPANTTPVTIVCRIKHPRKQQTEER